MPARKYCGRKTKLKIWFDALVSDIVFSKRRPKAPPMKHESSATGTSRATCAGVSGTRSTQAKSTNGILHEGDQRLSGAGAIQRASPSREASIASLASLTMKTRSAKAATYSAHHK